MSDTLPRPPTVIPFSQHPLMRTSDLDEARSLTRRLYDTAEVERGASSTGFYWEVNRAVLGPIGITAGWIPEGCRMATTGSGERYILSLARAGIAAVDCAGSAGEVAPGRAGMFASPELPVYDQMSVGFAPLTLTVDRTVLEQHFCKLTQVPLHQPLRFSPMVDISTGPGAGLLRLVEFLIKELEQPDGLHASPLARASLSDALLTALLTCAPHDQSHQLSAPGPLVRPGYLRRAETYIDAHASEPITMSDVAGVAGVSLRALQKAFVRYRGCSPKDFLKERRLELVRGRLLAADLDTSIKAAATAAGYGNTGRFAADYKQRFGESPSATRRRVRGDHRSG